MLEKEMIMRFEEDLREDDIVREKKMSLCTYNRVMFLKLNESELKKN